MHLYGKNVQNFKQLLLSLWANFAQISYGASLGWGNEKLLKWSRSVDQDGRHAHMEKTFKNLLLQNRECLGAEPLQESSGTGGLPTLLKEVSYVHVWLFYGKVKFASLCIWMGKTFKNLLLQNRACLLAESLYISFFVYIFGNRRATKIAKIMVVHWHLTFLH